MTVAARVLLDWCHSLTEFVTLSFQKMWEEANESLLLLRPESTKHYVVKHSSSTTSAHSSTCISLPRLCPPLPADLCGPLPQLPYPPPSPPSVKATWTHLWCQCPLVKLQHHFKVESFGRISILHHNKGRVGALFLIWWKEEHVISTDCTTHLMKLKKHRKPHFQSYVHQEIWIMTRDRDTSVSSYNSLICVM